MKRILASVMCLVFVFNVSAQMTQASLVDASNRTIHFLYYLPGNYRATGTGHPLIISLHGIGETGDGSAAGIQSLYIGGIPKKIHDGSNMVFTYKSTTDGFVVMAPQLPTNGAWQNFYVDDMIDYAITHFNIDPARVFLTGYSLGGEATWNYAFTSSNIDNLAGIIPISANTGNTNYCNIAGNKVAVWAWQGGSDMTYGGASAMRITNDINDCSNLIIPAYDTTFANYVHGNDFWDNKAYNITNDVLLPNIYQWMLKINRNLNIAGNALPIASATISGQTTLNLNTPLKFKDLGILDGSASNDPDDIIVNYLWEQTSGPAVIFGTAPNLPFTPNFPSTHIADPAYQFGVLAGNYKFRLRVQDYLTTLPGHTQFATINLNITYPDGAHSAPSVDAGGSRVISVATDKQRGDAFYYPCGNCNAKVSNWSLVSQPAGANAAVHDYNNNTLPYSPGEIQASFVNMTVDGDYKFRYSVTTQNNDVGSDILTLTKTSSALPVNFSYFNGSNAGNKNILSWATTSEINSERFDIQRSTDGVSFATIGKVTSNGGASVTTYSYEDNNAPFGLTYYRLSQVDKDGHSSLSTTISINNRKTGLYIEKYPNPAHDNLTVTVQGSTLGTLQVVIADMQGKTILQQQWQKDISSLKKVVNIGSLKSGVYQMIVTAGSEKQVSSFIKY